MSALAWANLLSAAGGDWHYTIDHPREEQQANFCDSRRSVEEIAAVFERFGPRTGYAALSNAPDCATGVRSFTPRKIVTTVTVAKGKPGEYKVGRGRAFVPRAHPLGMFPRFQIANKPSHGGKCVLVNRRILAPTPAPPGSGVKQKQGGAQIEYSRDAQP